MIRNWGIRHEHGRWRRYRYSLMLGAEFDDMIGVLGRIANVCGRPRKDDGLTAFTLSIQSNKTETLDYVKSVMSGMSLPGTQAGQIFFQAEQEPQFRDEQAFETDRGSVIVEEAPEPAPPAAEVRELVEEPVEPPADFSEEPIEAAQAPAMEEPIVLEEPALEPVQETAAMPVMEPEPQPDWKPVPEPLPEQVREEPVPAEEPPVREEPSASAAAEQPRPQAAEERVIEEQPAKQVSGQEKIEEEAELTAALAVPAVSPEEVLGEGGPQSYLEAELQKLESRLIPQNIAQAAAQQKESEEALRARIEAEIKAKISAEENAKKLAESSIRKEEEMKRRIEIELRAKLEAEEQARQKAEENARLADAAAQKEAEIRARLEAEIRAKLEAELQAASEPAQEASPPETPAEAPQEPVAAVEPRKGPLVMDYGAAGPRKPSWSIEIPLVPTYNFETLVVGANRFAHAAGMSVIESPGTMYNPLMLHGPSCCGKSHFVHAIAYGLSKDLGQQNVFVTDGIRFSRGILRLAKEGKLDALEKTLSEVKALLIDDIHLMSVNDQNRDFISRWLNHFVEKKKQIVITSLYPPKNLARLESSTGFKLNQGWIVELKPSSPAQAKTIVQSMVTRSGIELSDEDVARYLSDTGLSLNRIADVLDKVRVMSNVQPPEAARNYPEMLAAILGTKEESGTLLPTEDDMRTAKSYSMPAGTSWGGWGFFYPRGMDQYVSWVIYQICEKMKELGVGGGFDSSVRLEYDAANLIVSAFKITDACSEKGLRGAVVILPPDEYAPEQARKEFAHTLEHLTATLFIRCAMIEASSLAKNSAYLEAVLNMVA